MLCIIELLNVHGSRRKWFAYFLIFIECSFRHGEKCRDVFAVVFLHEELIAVLSVGLRRSQTLHSSFFIVMNGRALTGRIVSAVFFLPTGELDRN